MIYTGFAVMILQCGYNRWLHGVYKSCDLFTLLLCLLQLAS